MAGQWGDTTKFTPEKAIFFKNSTQLTHAISLLGWLRDVARALARCKSIRVVHGDIKPANILIMRSCLAALADFGVATRVADGQLNTPWQGGTSNYMSPESMSCPVDGAGSVVGFPTDIYAFGVMTIELIVGHVSNVIADVVPELVPVMGSMISTLATARPSADEVWSCLEGAMVKLQAAGADRQGSSAALTASLVSDDPAHPAAVARSSLRDLQRFVQLRVATIDELRRKDFMAQWDMQGAWLTCDAVGCSAQLGKFIYSQALLRWRGETCDVLEGMEDGLEEMELAMQMVRGKLAREEGFTTLQKEAEEKTRLFNSLYRTALTAVQAASRPLPPPAQLARPCPRSFAMRGGNLGD